MPTAGTFSHFENSRLDHLPPVDRKRWDSLTRNSKTALTLSQRPTDQGGEKRRAGTSGNGSNKQSRRQARATGANGFALVPHVPLSWAAIVVVEPAVGNPHRRTVREAQQRADVDFVPLSPPIFLRLTLHGGRNNSGSLAMPAAIRRAALRVNSFARDRRPTSSRNR
jgi:hypothetical protein